MFHEIAPHTFDISMRFDAPNLNDQALWFRECGFDNARAEVALACAAEGELRFPRCGDLPDSAVFTYLFSIDGNRYYHASVPEGAQPASQVESAFRFQRVGSLVSEQADVNAFAAMTGLHLHAWYRNNAFCGRCGSPMAPAEGERALVCAECGNTAYPRIAPAVIVAVTDGDRLLLTRYAQGDYRKLALVAGFVEVGETPEEAVAREVWEECGVRVKDVRYFASQPWGLSSSLMLGFTARLDGSPDVTLQDGELGWAGWVARDELEGDEDYALGHAMIGAFREGAL